MGEVIRMDVGGGSAVAGKEGPVKESAAAEKAEKVDILLVDDQPEKLLAMEAVLSELGENLIRAKSGQEALRLLLKREFAVIVMDVSMPGMSGFETASLIRQRKNLESIPIIFVTAIGGTELDQEKGYSLGAVDYIFSPIIPSALKSKVRVFAELHRKTEQIRKMNARLEQMVRDRTKQLELANQELVRMSRIKADFMAMVSHELRTPLSSIKTGIDIVLAGIEGDLEPGQRSSLSIAKSNVDRLARLIDNVLDFSRMETGRLDAALEQTDMGELVRETCHLMKMEAARKRIRIEIQVGAPKTLAVCDSDKIRQVLINLIHNAVKFTKPDGKIAVRLEEPDDQVRISVEDTGIGISPEDQKKIFDTFEQGADSRKRVGGVGLGLAIAKKYMELHSGSIQVESKVGEGSKFTVVFPRGQK